MGKQGSTDNSADPFLLWRDEAGYCGTWRKMAENGGIFCGMRRNEAESRGVPCGGGPQWYSRDKKDEHSEIIS